LYPVKQALEKVQGQVPFTAVTEKKEVTPADLKKTVTPVPSVTPTESDDNKSQTNVFKKIENQAREVGNSIRKFNLFSNIHHESKEDNKDKQEDSGIQKVQIQEDSNSNEHDIRIR
jgi:hypothetical protein